MGPRLTSSVATVTLALCVAASTGAQGRPDFSGTWKPAASNAGQPAPPGPTLVITQTADTLAIERRTIARGAERIEKLTYALNDTPSTNPGAGGKIVSKSHWEGATLVTTWMTDFESDEGKIPIENIEVRSLSADGRTLTIETTQKSPRASETRKQQFVKQP